MTKEVKRLLVNLGALLLLAGAVMTVIFVFFRSDDELQIEDTPIQIEAIRTIAEISTVSYKDEVVMDSIEYSSDQYSFYDPRKYWDLYNRSIARRLTLIITGEVRYGIDLTDGNFDIVSTQDSVTIILPEPEMLDVIIVPSKTEIYLEKGDWKDHERRRLEASGRNKLIENAEAMHLDEKARENTIRLFKKLIDDPRKIHIEFRADD
jgi:hypothetical protein